MTTTTTTATAPAAEGFAGLLAQLDSLSTVSKAMSADCGDGKGGEADADGTKKIMAAAADGGAEGADGDKETEGDDVMGKALQVTLADGSVVEAFDGTAMMKALATRIDGLDGASGEFAKGMALAIDVLNSLQQVVVAQREQIAEQDKILKSLQADVVRIGGSGTGRRTLVNILDKAATTVATPAQKPNREELLSKALTAQKRGDITGLDVARIELRLNSGVEIPADLLRAINAA